MGAGPSHHDMLRQREEWEREQRGHREHMEHQHREREEKIRREAEQRAQEERERRDREQREEREKFEAEVRARMEESERQQREAIERERQRQAEYQNEVKRHMEEMERQRMEGEVRAEEELAKQEERMREEMERKEAAAKAEKEELQKKAAEEAERERKRHEAEQRRMEEESQARLAAQEAETERKLQEQQEAARREKEVLEKSQAELEKKYMSGIQPEVWPTSEERSKAAAQLLEPREQYFHCAIAGLAGSGKSSLINAFRGLRNGSTSAEVAPTGVTETTLEICGYRDPSPEGNRFVWYDVPGAGTIKIKGWQYFNSQGLFVFDLIIVVVDNRFSEQDLIILQHCERYKIPSFIVRSKANQHINNTMKQKLHWEDSEDERDFNEVYMQARKTLIAETRKSIRSNLLQGGLDASKKVYIVSCDALVALVCDEKKKLRKQNQLIDERELLAKLLGTIDERRF